MSKLFVVHGHSNTGKTHVLDYWAEQFGLPTVTPFGFTKRFLEQLHGLPAGALELPKYKEVIPNGATVSLGQMMVDLYHFWAKRDPFYAARSLHRELTEHLSAGRDVCVGGLRNLAEVGVIYDLSLEFHHVSVLRLTRPGSNGLSSDQHCEAISAKLFKLSDSFDVYDNSKSLEELEKAAFWTIYKTMFTPSMGTVA